MIEKNLTQIMIPELLQLHSAVLGELKNRGVVRTKNNPTGDYTEWLVANRLGLTLAPKSAKGFDAQDSSGLRYQVKGRRITPENQSDQLGVIRNLDGQDFDFLVGIIFDTDWNVLRAAKIPHSLIGKIARFSEHQNGHIMHLRPSILSVTGIENIGDVLGLSVAHP